ncbi:MAG: CBS domain-containing protein [Thermoplasmatota archaeon]
MSKGKIIVREAMRMKPVTLTPKDSVQDAAVLMTKHKIGNCIVIDKKPIGIITESDIIRKVVSKGKSADKVNVSEIMTTPIMVIDPYVDLDEAMKIMGKCNIRRLPVIENDKLLGIITIKDIARLSPILREISDEWSFISPRDETYYKQQTFSGKCEDCSTLSTNLRNVDGRLLCEDCIDALKYE